MFRATVRPDVYLTLLEERHAPALFGLVERERKQLRDWLKWVDVTRTEDDIAAFIRRTLEQFAAGDGLNAAIWVEARLAGMIGMHKIDWPNRRVELGYWLAHEVQGRGIMTEACRAVTLHALAELELNRVEIRCATGNEKSKAIPRRLGFTHEGTLREAELVNGRFLDLEVYAMLRRDWKHIRQTIL
jgi:ribosomal-protein-serine acetyltransferase